MSVDYFQFKQFIVHHLYSTMKVGTDAVLLGTLSDLPTTGKILDSQKFSIHRMEIKKTKHPEGHGFRSDSLTHHSPQYMDHLDTSTDKI